MLFLTVGALFPGAKVIEDLLPGWTALAQELGAIMYEPGTVKTVSGNLTFLPAAYTECMILQSAGPGPGHLTPLCLYDLHSPCITSPLCCCMQCLRSHLLWGVLIWLLLPMLTYMAM